MISHDFLKKISTKQQTTEINVLREYLQHLFLFYFYQRKEAEEILFKGGTALRIIYNSPRFSEDLDFSGKKFNKSKLESLLVKTLSKIQQEEVKVELKEAKATSGGYLAIYFGDILDQKIRIKIEISFRKKRNLQKEVDLINQKFTPPYTLLHLAESQIAAEKVSALIDRAKPRDWYDLYFILRSRLAMDKKTLNKGKNLKKEILLKLEDLNTNELQRDLKPLLPLSHHQILNNFDNKIKREIRKYL